MTVDLAKIGLQKSVLREVRKATPAPRFETAVLKMPGIDKLKEARKAGAYLRFEGRAGGC